MSERNKKSIHLDQSAGPRAAKFNHLTNGTVFSLAILQASAAIKVTEGV